MAEASKPAAKARKPGWVRRYRWPLSVALFLVMAELLSAQFVARPNRILRRSRDPEMVYELTPGTWLGHAKYDVWRAPLYVILDFIHQPAEPDPSLTRAPAGYTLYRIDSAGCRQASTGPFVTRDDVVLIGSSQSFGLLLPYEDTVSAQLETALRGRGLDGVHVGNCSVIGHHFLPSLRTAELVAPLRTPKVDIILVRPWHMTVQFDYTKVIEPQNPVARAVIDHSSFARLLFYLANRQSSQFDSPLVPDSVVDARLARYAQRMNDAHVRSIFFLLDDHTPDCAVFDRLEPILRRQGLTVERLESPLLQGPRNASNPYYVDHDEHWNRAGGALITREMLDSVERELRAAN